MKVLICHNYYQQPGGEDLSFSAEAALLESHGHEVIRFVRHNDAIDGMNRWRVASKTIWNRQVYREMRALIRRTRPAVLHCINTFPLISPASYYAARHEGIGVIQSLRNYRLLCPGATCLRDGHVCEDCVHKKFAWPAIMHRCYRGTFAGSSVVAAMLALHRVKRTWTKVVDLYYALTAFSRDRFIEGGFPADKIIVKPNFLGADPGPGDGAGRFALFVGRLAPEKGIDTLLSAWSQLDQPIPLQVVGDGPLRDSVRAAASHDGRITWLGYRKPSEILQLAGAAAFLVVPSRWYEGLPRTIIEAFARGTPMIGSDFGSTSEVNDIGRTGLQFKTGDARDLADKVRLMWADPGRLARMRLECRREFERKYTPDANYVITRTMYERAIAAARRRGRKTQLATGE